MSSKSKANKKAKQQAKGSRPKKEIAKQQPKTVEDEVAQLADVFDTYETKKRNKKSLKGLTNPIDAMTRSSKAANKKFMELWAKSMYEAVNGEPAPENYGVEGTNGPDYWGDARPFAGWLDYFGHSSKSLCDLKLYTDYINSLTLRKFAHQCIAVVPDYATFIKDAAKKARFVEASKVVA